MRNRGLLVAIFAVLVLATAASGAPTSTHVHFTAVGDYSASSATGRVLEGVASAAPDAHFALGDLSYGETGAEDVWCDFVKDRVGEGFPFELLSGNHESNGQNGNINDFSACLPNQLPGLVGTYGRQYYVDVPQENPLIRFVMVSPALTYPEGTYNYGAGSSRHAWTAAAIDGARADGIPWVVVGMHKPCLSVGQYGCEPGTGFVDMLLAKKVDLVLSGHEHHYARTDQLALGAGCLTLAVGTFSPACVEDTDDAYTAGAGTVFMTVGTGGVSQRDVSTVDPEAPYFTAMSGPNLDPANGFADFDVTPEAMTVGFVPTDGTFTDAFTLTKDPNAPVNTPPVAAFTSSANGLVAGFDASGSTDPDPDGAILSYAWDFDDGEFGVGQAPTHTFDNPGTYQVTLTVTDDDGGTASVTQPVVVTAPAQTSLVVDQFERTLTNAWGTPDVGGPWSVVTASGVSSVSGGQGRTVMRTPGARPVSSVNGVSVADVEVRLEFGLDKVPTGAGSRVEQSVVVRRSGTGEYRAGVQVLPGGGVRARFSQVVNAGGTTVLGGVVTVPGTYAPGNLLEVLVRVTGGPAADLRMKVWPKGTAEPAGWTLIRTDVTAPIFGAGGVSIAPYLSTGATNAPIQARYDDFHVVTP